jgi:hypothetical protein
MVGTRIGILHSEIVVLGHVQTDVTLFPIYIFVVEENALIGLDGLHHNQEDQM